MVVWTYCIGLRDEYWNSNQVEIISKVEKYQEEEYIKELLIESADESEEQAKLEQSKK